MKKIAILTLSFSAIAAGSTVSAQAEGSAHSCLVTPNFGARMSLSRCYERSNLAQLKRECNYLKGTTQENKPCPTGQYAVCRAQKPDGITEYFYAPNGEKPTAFQLESGKEMCESKRDTVWEPAQ